MEAIKLENVTFRYPEGVRAALSNIDLSVSKGELVLLEGASGSGKTTLLRLLKRSIAPHGELSGNIFINGRHIEKMTEREAVSNVGFVFQNAENGIVTETVYRELAFILESLGLNSSAIRRKVAETAMYYGIEELYRRKISSLSGGEKQLLSLASVTVSEPMILLLDEPTSQLDPISAKSFLSAVFRLNKELGVTVIISEHRSDELFPNADRVVFLDKGRVTVNAAPSRAAANKSLPFGALPEPARICRLIAGDVGDDIPLSTPQARDFLTNRCIVNDEIDIDGEKTDKRETAVKLRSVSFRYENYKGKSKPILRDVTLDIYKGEILAIFGGNGAGKTTLLKIISRLMKPSSGKVKLIGGLKTGYLPQNPRAMFLCESVKEDLIKAGRAVGLSQEECEKKAEKMLGEFALVHLSARHPFDLSGGELQRAALAKLMMVSPDILLLDEPTKGMDHESIRSVMNMIVKLKERSVTVVIVTHDAQAAALCADRCALLFDGEIVSSDCTRRFFSELSHCTTNSAHIAKGIIKNAVLTEDIAACAKLRENGGDNNER